MSHTLTKAIRQTTVDEPKRRRLLNLRWQGVALGASLICLSMLHHHPLHAQSPTDKDESVKLTPASASLGQTPTAGGAFNRPYGFYLNPILEHIHASSDQREKITVILATYKPKIEPLRVEYRSKNAELLNKIAHGDRPETIMDIQTHLGHLYSEIIVDYCRMSLEVRKVLNPDQVVLYEEFKRKQGWRSAPVGAVINK